MCRANVAASYKKVVASLFTPSATIYRLHQGIPMTASAMAVACIEMVEPVSSGVAYSHDPVNLIDPTLVQRGMGLGRYAVDGLVAPDMWIFTREDSPFLCAAAPAIRTASLPQTKQAHCATWKCPKTSARCSALRQMKRKSWHGWSCSLKSTTAGIRTWSGQKPLTASLFSCNPPAGHARRQEQHAQASPARKLPLLLEGGGHRLPRRGLRPGIHAPYGRRDLARFPQGAYCVRVPARNTPPFWTGRRP